MKLRNQFFEFLDFGIGNQPAGCNSNRCGQQFQAYERDTVPTINTFVAGNIIRAYALDSRDVGKRSLIQGTDSNDKTIYGTSVLTGKPILGETISLALPFVDTVNIFNSVLSIQKEPTVGDVVYYQVDPLGVETPLHTMQATEQTGQYRRYFLNGLKNTCCQAATQQVLALCKLDFIPVESDQDYLLIQSIPALLRKGWRCAIAGWTLPAVSRWLKRNTPMPSVAIRAIDHFLGKFQTAITVPIFGSDRLRPQFNRVMPKQIQPPAPAYGSDAWKAERARMVGTPEWAAANNRVIPRADNPMSQGVSFQSPLVFTPAGKTLTTAEKQAQTSLYNPLYDPGSAEYQANLVNTSMPSQQRRPIQNPLTQFNAPLSTPQIPQLQPQPQGPVAPPQQQAPQITLPQQFQQNYNTPPGSPQNPSQGIKMPNIQKPLQSFGSGSNWTDFLTVAHNRNLR